MPLDPAQPLSNPKRELYAQGLSRGLDQTKAQVEAGYKPNRGNAARLNADESIRTRVAYLQGRNIQKQDAERSVSLADLHRELDLALDIAVKSSDARAIVMITQTRAKLGGLWVDRSEQTTRVLDPSTMSTRAQDSALIEFMLKGRLTEQQLNELMNGRIPVLPAPPAKQQ
jgi:hypothetical protein